MPRRRKTQSGEPAQRIESVPGQRYGEGKAQADMQRAMPAPASRDAAAPVVQSPPPQNVQQGAIARPPVNPDQYLASLPKGLLRNGDTTGPNTAGLSTGPGPGPEVLPNMGTSNPLRRTLRALYDATGDERLGRIVRGGF